jgi:hypothetical protein
MRASILRTATAGVATTLFFLTAGPASAAQEPNGHATCLAEVFQAQAVAAPQTVSDRILFIREVLLGDDQFGQVLQPLAHDMC